MSQRAEAPATFEQHPHIARALLDSYFAASYEIYSSPKFVLRIGEPSAALRLLHMQSAVTCSCVITAFNPFGEQASDAANRQAQSRLQLELAERGVSFVAAQGCADNDAWPAEPGLLALGIALDEVRHLCVAYRQNAVVYSAQDATPRLMLHPEALLGA